MTNLEQLIELTTQEQEAIRFITTWKQSIGKENYVLLNDCWYSDELGNQSLSTEEKVMNNYFGKVLDFIQERKLEVSYYYSEALRNNQE